VAIFGNFYFYFSFLGDFFPQKTGVLKKILFSKSISENGKNSIQK